MDAVGSARVTRRHGVRIACAIAVAEVDRDLRERDPFVVRGGAHGARVGERLRGGHVLLGALGVRRRTVDRARGDEQAGEDDRESLRREEEFHSKWKHDQYQTTPVSSQYVFSQRSSIMLRQVNSRVWYNRRVICPWERMMV